MKTWMGIRRLGVVGGLIIAGLGCEGQTLEPTGEQKEQTAPAQNLAEVALADGSRLTFVEPQAGVLLAEAEGGPGSAAIALFQEYDRNALALYMAATNLAAPPALVEAQVRADGARTAATEKEDRPDATVELKPTVAGALSGDGELGTQRQPLSEADYISLHCPGTHNFLYCYTNVTSTWVITRNAEHVHACVNAVDGDLHRRLEYDSGSFSDWTTSRDTTVNQGTTICTMLQVGNNATYRFTVDQATGDVWHGSFYGNL